MNLYIRFDYEKNKNKKGINMERRNKKMKKNGRKGRMEISLGDKKIDC